MEKQSPILTSLSNQDVLRIADEAFNGGDELEAAQNLMRGEIARRGLTMAMNERFYDASQDEPANPVHNDEQWAYFVPTDPAEFDACEGCS